MTESNNSNEKGCPMASRDDQHSDDLARKLDFLKIEFEKTEKELAEKIAFLQTLIDTIPCPIFYKDADGVYRGCNTAFEAYIGRAKEDIVGITVYDIAPKELADVYRDADLAMFRNPGVQQYEALVRYADGQQRDVMFSKATFNDADGNVAGLVGVMLDISERKVAERALRESERRLQDVIQGFPLPTFAIGKDHAVLHWNGAMEEFSGIRAKDVIGTCDHWKAFYAEERPCLVDLLLDGKTDRFSRRYSAPVIKSALQNGAYEITEFLPQLGDGGMWLRATAALWRDTEGRVKGGIETVEDITERKRAEAELVVHKNRLEDLVAERTRELSTINTALQREVAERKVAEAALSRAHDELELQVAQRTHDLVRLNETLTRLSLQDGLTGISNRRYFDEFLEREWQRGRRAGSALAIIMADVDCFKAYNDSYGHQAGDACLKAVAGVLEATMKRAVDLVARYGGEEFVIVLPGTDLTAAMRLAESARAGVEALHIEHRTSAVAPSESSVFLPCVTISLGVACAIPREEMQAAQLVAAADAGLYEAKRRGRNRVEEGVLKAG